MSQSWFTTAQAHPEPHVPAGWHVLHYDSIDGTNAALKRLVEGGSEVHEGLMVWAKTQTAGRGRSGRAWVSPPGNVYVSILVAAPEKKTSAPELGFVAAIAVVDTIQELPRHNAAPPVLQCKWPNDVLVEGKKVCGILPELANDPDGKAWIILGVGINLVPVELDAAAFPPSALALHHIDTTPAHVLTVLSRTLLAWLARWREGGFGAIRGAWQERGPQIGAAVSVNLASGPESGTFAGLDEDGALLIDSSGGRQRIIAGDVLFGGDA